MPALIHKKPDGTERKLEFSAKPIVVGRLNESDVPVRDPFISRVHCGFSFTNDQFNVKDLGSTNGTYRNGSRVFECNLASGDKIQIGNTTLVFEVDTVSGNATLRQVPQMAAPTRAPGPASSGPPRPDHKGATIQVKLPGARPTVISAPPAAPPGKSS